jgi:hypothetical protein
VQRVHGADRCCVGACVLFRAFPDECTCWQHVLQQDARGGVREHCQGAVQARRAGLPRCQVSARPVHSCYRMCLCVFVCVLVWLFYATAGDFKRLLGCANVRANSLLSRRDLRSQVMLSRRSQTACTCVGHRRARAYTKLTFVFLAGSSATTESRASSRQASCWPLRTQCR